MRELRSRPLNPEDYAPFGRVIAARDSGERAANQGTARKYEHLVPLENLRAGATANVSVFRCVPRALPFEIALLEKHPASTQLFVPMNARRYLVVVARGSERPDLSTLAAFEATGTQGISYAPGTWHHPLIALESETDFACLVFEDGSPSDCVEHAIELSERIVVTPSRHIG
ncbi:MAG: ureidoglycolate lyase [Polyangiales bacterium]